jgi:hypothetical protein
MGFLAFCRKLTQSLTISMLLFVSAGAMAVLLWPHSVRNLSHNLARFPLLALICCAWSILCAAIARKSGSSAHGCRNLAAKPFWAVCILLWLVTSNASFGVFSVWSLAAGLFCRKLVYPDLAWNDPDVKTFRSLTTLQLNP